MDVQTVEDMQLAEQQKISSTTAPGWPLNSMLLASTQWFEAWQLANAISLKNMQEVMRSWDPQTLRRRVLSDLSQGIERYMRSPEFLQLMKSNLAAMSGFPQLDGGLGTAARDARRPD